MKFRLIRGSRFSSFAFALSPLPCFSPFRLCPFAFALLVWVGVLAPVSACPFCSMQGQTLVDEVNQASMVLYGSLANAKLDPDGAYGQGTTDLHVEAVVKKHDILAGRTLLPLPRYLPSDTSGLKFLIFCDVFQGKIDPYRGVPVKKESNVVKYLDGALAVKDKAVGDRLRFYFDSLDDPDVEISNDAYKAFGNAAYAEYRDMAKKLPADRIARWLRDPNTPPARYGLYASMLGHCGTDKDAELLRAMLDDSQKKITSGVDGMMAGYAMLKPADGWAYVRGLLSDPTKDFSSRYAALRAARFFRTTRPDLVDPKKVEEGVCLLLDDPNMADLAIEDLRQWQCWDVSDRVLGLFEKPSYNIPILHRAILKFALTSPQPKAAEFVSGLRKQDPELVTDTEEWLKLEKATPAGKSATAEGPKNP